MKLENKASSIGGSAIRIISSDYVAKNDSSGAITQAQVLKWDFTKK